MPDHSLNIKQLNSKLASYKKYKPFFSTWEMYTSDIKNIWYIQNDLRANVFGVNYRHQNSFLFNSTP